MSTVEFNSLLSGNAEFLKPFAFNLTKNTGDAQDLFQETLYRALANKEKYHFGTNIRGWLYTIMKNTFISIYRRKIKCPTVTDLSANEFLLDHNQSVIINNAESRLRVKEIERSVYHLPLVFRKPFQMYFDGYKYYEIAEMLQEPLGTVKSRIHFARKLLKEQVSRF